tara:strand:+ start:702 stop:968 length:267 start_codon:yes stop_codon:yes gene_type:complete
MNILKKQKMTEKEKNEIKGIISEYAKCHNDISKLESEIKVLLSRKDSLLRTLKHIRNTEKYTVNKLKKKYGEDAAIDLEKLEIIDGKA